MDMDFKNIIIGPFVLNCYDLQINVPHDRGACKVFDLQNLQKCQKVH